MKALRFLIPFSLVLMICYGIGYLLVTNVDATSDEVWGEWEYQWGACEPVNECGAEGVMTGTKTRTCVKDHVPGSVHECEIEKVWSWDIWDWIYIPETQTEEVEQACKLEEYLPCEEPTPTPSPEPTPTEEPGPPAPDPWTPPPYEANVCDNPGDAPKNPTLQLLGSSGPGCLKWRLSQTDPYDKAFVNYGYSPSDLLYGIADLGSHESVVEFDTCELETGQHVWAKVGTERTYCVSYSEAVDPLVE